MNHEYDDIIHLPHHVSKRHPQMSMEARAAQFAPFAALTTHPSAIRETARMTDEKITLSEDFANELNQQMMLLYSRAADNPLVSITFFLPAQKKSGGSYQVSEGRLKKIDESKQQILMDNGTCIEFQSIIDIKIKE